jgi:hypothetical protein
MSQTGCFDPQTVLISNGLQPAADKAAGNESAPGHCRVDVSSLSEHQLLIAHAILSLGIFPNLLVSAAFDGAISYQLEDMETLYEKNHSWFTAQSFDLSNRHVSSMTAMTDDGISCLSQKSDEEGTSAQLRVHRRMWPRQVDQLLHALARQQ